ncbi:uncharacterized protein LOC114338711 isoform X5 [Diabrotica virgifera virgifera]|uniref:Uncharacterized protein n=1 Tax=Diabrotica virgifera virgifera TaxID=50390 RepID=A0ABM5JLN6_DIAVI|nr:uncharacterized protein LOC114338711 isoform X5 [Diabrotica virgifera virgifera]
MEVKQEQNNFLDEDCKIKIENINLSHDGLYHSVKLEVKDELSPADSPNTNTINYCGDGYSSDKLKVETIVKDIKLEETEAEPQQTENGSRSKILKQSKHWNIHIVKSKGVWRKIPKQSKHLYNHVIKSKIRVRKNLINVKFVLSRFLKNVI